MSRNERAYVNEFTEQVSYLCKGVRAVPMLSAHVSAHVSACVLVGR